MTGVKIVIASAAKQSRFDTGLNFQSFDNQIWMRVDQISQDIYFLPHRSITKCCFTAFYRRDCRVPLVGLGVLAMTVIKRSLLRGISISVRLFSFAETSPLTQLAANMGSDRELSA